MIIKNKNIRYESSIKCHIVIKKKPLKKKFERSLPNEHNVTIMIASLLF